VCKDMSQHGPTVEDVEDVIKAARDERPQTRRRRFDRPITEIRAGKEVGTAFLLEFDLALQDAKCDQIVPGDEEKSMMRGTESIDGDVTKLLDAVDTSLYETLVDGITRGLDAREEAVKTILDKKAHCSEVYQSSEEEGTAVFAVIIGDQWEKTTALCGSTVHDTQEDVMYDIVAPRGNAVIIEPQEEGGLTSRKLHLFGNDSLKSSRYVIVDSSGDDWPLFQ